MKIKNLDVRTVEETRPMQMIVRTRGKGRPDKSGRRSIEVKNPKVVVLKGHTYVHASDQGKTASFGSGTEVIFK